MSASSKPAAGKPARGAPVTAHPLFPAVVALWFGALFGLGSLAVRVGLLETLVLATRIDTLIPAAAPPLGISARILLALTLAAIGALLGAAIARRIAAPKPVVRERKRKAVLSPDETVNLRSRDAHPDAPARRPLSINDALGDAPTDHEQAAADPLAGRRRSALAIETDDTFELHELAPLPGGNPQILPLAEAANAAFGDTPLELGDYAEADEDRLAPPTLDWHNAASSASHADYDPNPLPDFSPPSDAVSGRQVFGMSQPQPDEVLDELGITDAEFEPLPAADAEPEAAAEPATGDPSTMPMTDLAKRLADSMQRRRARNAEAAKVDGIAATATVAFVPEAAVAPAAMAESAAFPSFTHPNDIPIPPVPALPAASYPVPEVNSESAPEPAPEPIAEPFAAPVTSLSFSAPHQQLFGAEGHQVPAGLRPLSFDAMADDDDGEALVSFLPPRSFPGVGQAQQFAAAPAVPFEAPTAAVSDDEIAADDKFSSLLDLGRTAEPRQSFVRIDDSAEAATAIEPVVIFPGQVARAHVAPAAPVDFDAVAGSFRQFDSPASADTGQGVAAATAKPHNPAETERALRAALANLQRMSGAA